MRGDTREAPATAADSVTPARLMVAYALLKTVLVILLLLLSGGPEVSPVDVIYQGF